MVGFGDPPTDDYVTVQVALHHDDPEAKWYGYVTGIDTGGPWVAIRNDSPNQQAADDILFPAHAVKHIEVFRDGGDPAKEDGEDHP